MTRVARILAWGYWQLSNGLDKIPGFNDAISDLYNRDVDREYAKMYGND